MTTKTDDYIYTHSAFIACKGSDGKIFKMKMFHFIFQDYMYLVTTPTVVNFDFTKRTDVILFHCNRQRAFTEFICSAEIVLKVFNC